MRLKAAALAAAILAACAGSDPVGDYVGATAAITETMTREAFAALPPGASPTREAVTGVVAARRTAFDSLSALEPPAEMAPEHLGLITAMERFVVAGEQFIADSATMGPDEFQVALEESTGIDLLADAVNAACLAWEVNAARLGSPVELGC